MEDLFRSITANPILLFIIIGAILRFMQRGKNQKTETETRKPGAPRSEESPRTEVDWREIFSQEARTEPPPPKSREQSYTSTKETTSSIDGLNRSNELLEKYEKAKLNKQMNDKLDKKLKKSPIYKGDLTVRKQVKLDFSNITKEDAIKGVVWSEILGRPRAKRSHRPGMNTTRKQG